MRGSGNALVYSTERGKTVFELWIKSELVADFHNLGMVFF